MPSWRERLALTAQRNRQEIVKAKLSRRDMARFGLLTATGALIRTAGLSSRAEAALADPDTSRNPPSPINRAWIQEMPRLPVLQDIDDHDMEGGPPDGTTPIDGATKRINHQYCSYNTNTNSYGGRFPPKKFYELVMQEGTHRFHPDYRTPTTIWGFGGLVRPNDGTQLLAPVTVGAQIPGPLIQAKYGEPLMVRFHNHLPSVSIPQNFGIAEITTHLHNAHTPSESDGNPVNYFNSKNDPNEVNPLGFKDQHYPNVLAGFTNPATPNGDPTEALSSLWYHDHHLDYTAQNVYKGMFGCYTLRDDQDTGEETSGLHLPGGKYDIPMFIHDAVFDQNFQIVFDLFNLDGILGDKISINGAIQPFLSVERRRYRLRLYNPGPSHWYQFAFWDGSKFYPFHQISSDGNLLPHAVPTTDVRIAVAERADIVVDFSKLPSSAKVLYLVNRLEQFNGRGPTGNVLSPGTPIMQIRIGAAPTSKDNSLDPAYYAISGPDAKGNTMRVLPDQDFNALLTRAGKARTRTWNFQRGNGAWTVNGQLFDETVVSAAIPMNSEEVWVIQNTGGDWRHPVHIHFEEHRTLSRNGQLVKPDAQFNASVDYARKDVVELNTNEEVRIFMRFRDMRGRYVMHCHNVVHEDHAMMVRWDIV